MLKTALPPTNYPLCPNKNCIPPPKLTLLKSGCDFHALLKEKEMLLNCLDQVEVHSSLSQLKADTLRKIKLYTDANSVQTNVMN